MSEDDIPEPIESVEPVHTERQEMARAGRQMTLGALIISFFLALGRFAGFIKNIVMAHFFGASGLTSAFLSIYNVIIFGFYTKIESLLRPTYLPEFVRVRDRDGEDKAFRIAGSATLLEVIALLIMSAALVIFARPLIHLLWPAAAWATDPFSFEAAVVMLRLMVPAFLFLSLSLMPELTLHAYKRFALPAFAEFCFRAGMILVMVGALYLVWRPGNPVAIYAAALGVVVGSSLRFLVMIPGLRSQLRLLRFSPFWREKSVVLMLALMPPVILSLIFSWLRVWTDSLFGNSISKGAYTCLVYGRSMVDAPGQILPLAVSFVVYPFLSQWAVQNERARLGRTLVGMTRAMAFVYLPITIGLMVMARPIISLFFGHGQFRPEDVDLAALALYCYAPSMAFLSVEGSINKWYFALQNTWTPSFIGILSACLHIAISWFGVTRLNGSVAAIALALTISKSLKVIVLYILLRRRVEEVDLPAQVNWGARLALAVSTMALLVWFVAGRLTGFFAGWHPPVGGDKVRLLALLCSVGAFGMVWYLAACWLFGVEEVRAVAARLRAKVARSGGSA
jgi:putative peptidoglycan lipid II flippase